MKINLLTGHRKSGTTLLHKLLDGHPQLNVYPVDVCLLYAFLPCKHNPDSASQNFERIELVLRQSLQSLEGKPVPNSNRLINCTNFVKALKYKLDPKRLNNPVHLLLTLAETWCKHFELDEQQPFIFKETSQTIHAAALLNDCTPMRITQIIRDPRDNYAAIKSGIEDYYSKLGEGYHEALASVINRSRMDLSSAARLIAAKEPNFHAFKFEDLASDPETALRALADACHFDFSETMLTPTVLGETFLGNSFDSGSFTKISSRNVSRWHERISAYEACVIEFWLADVMKYWGYPPAHPPEQAMTAFSQFYQWYNCKYFYHDSFSQTLSNDEQR